MLLYILVGWIALSIPVALVVGMAIRRGQRAIPVARVEIPIDQLVPISRVPTPH